MSLLVDYLLPLLTEEAELLRGVKGDIKDINSELQFIQNYLKDADARAEKGDSNDVAGTYVKQVREQAYHIEDVIDEYIIHVAKSQQRNKIGNFIHNVKRSSKKLKTRHDIATEIRAIKGTIQEIYNTSVRCGFTPSAGTGGAGVHNYRRNLSWPEHRVVPLFVDERELVGIESPRDELIGWLDVRASHRSVISVVGMGGIGKTTLAKRVYDSRTSTPMAHFDCHACVIVSELHHKVELLRSMIRQFYESRKEPAPNAINTMDLPSLMKAIQNYLKQKRYVVLLDDVWQLGFWSFIKNVLPNNEGCKIILTTQSQNIAASCHETPFDHIYPLQALTEEQSWELFCKKAFQSEFGGNCPPDLEEQSCHIVKKCEGLPLAIVTVGSLLSAMEKDISEWRKFHDNLGTGLGSNPGLSTITKILSLSYNDLPYNYKPCLLYFGLFPEDYSINCKRLIKLWIAEGFLKRDGAKTMEEIGEEYLNELIQRNLVQVSMVNLLGKSKRCRVHNLMREIILLKSYELSFCQILAKDDSSMEGVTRRLSICYSIDKATKNIRNSLIRSVLFFKASGLPNNFLTNFCSNFKLLRVFDLQYAPIDCLPKEVGDLLNLRYLSIRGTKVKTLPKSIGKLYNLHTLDLKFTRVQDLPIEIKMLEKLLYLLSYYNNGEVGPSFNSGRGVRIQNGIGCLKTLQKLYCVEANNEFLIRELGMLRLLRKLGITKLTAASCQAFCSSIEKMIHLRSLCVYAITENETIDLSSISFPPPFVHDINLCGRIAKLPDWIPKLKELVVLSLGWSGLSDDPLELLGPLKNLQRLWLRQAYNGEQLHFKTGWFPKLKVLGLTHLAGLNMLTIDKGAVSLLEELTIGPSQQLREVPFGIQYLKKLTALRFFDMPRDFVLRTLPSGGPDFDKVGHILGVFFNRSKDEGYQTYTLSNSNELKDSYR